MLSPNSKKLLLSSARRFAPSGLYCTVMLALAGKSFGPVVENWVEVCVNTIFPLFYMTAIFLSKYLFK